MQCLLSKEWYFYDETTSWQDGNNTMQIKGILYINFQAAVVEVSLKQPSLL
jgi:hypothetical protein